MSLGGLYDLMHVLVGLLAPAHRTLPPPAPSSPWIPTTAASEKTTDSFAESPSSFSLIAVSGDRPPFAVAAGGKLAGELLPQLQPRATDMWDQLDYKLRTWLSKGLKMVRFNL